MDLGSLKRVLFDSSFCLLVTGNMSTYVVNMGWERFYGNFKNLKINGDFLVKRCEISFQTCEKSLLVSHLVYYTYA